MSEVMETHSGKSSAVEQAPKGPTQPLGADRPAQSVGEYQSLIIPVATRDKPLSRLLRSLMAQQLDHACRYRDVSPRAMRLYRRDAQLTANPLDRLLNSNVASIEINVAPAQAPQLAKPQPCGAATVVAR